MQQNPENDVSQGPHFSVKCRFIKYYFNYDWEDYFNKKGRESLRNNAKVWQQQYIGGNMWEGIFHELGVPKLSYSGDGTHDELQVRRHILGVGMRVLAAEHVALTGREIRTVEAVTASGGDRFFDMKVAAGPKAHLAYRAEDGYLRLLWAESARFEFSSGANDIKHLLMEHYDRTKEMLLHTLELPNSAQMHDVRINLHAMPDNMAQDMKIGVLPRSAESSATPDTYPVSIVSNVNLGFSESVFPNVKLGAAPADQNWVLTLFLPPGYWQASSGRPEKYEDGYRRISYFSSPRTVATAAAPDTPWHINPVSKILQAGANRTGLSLTTAVANAQWSLEGETRGTLEKEGSNYYYTPPLVRNPAALFNEGTELMVAPAFRASVPNPVAVDSIKVTATKDTVSSTFVTQFVYPTHLIRAALFEGQIKLTLWYWSLVQEKEVQVPEKDVDWRVVAGGGAISESGIFTSGTLSCCTVLGIDNRAVDDWRWGITIVPYPFIGADNVVQFLQGEAQP
ncbi:hypothetical protein B8W72_18220 [Pseudomonas putida]|uniref:Uncharacterized protein n=1 Tax=Pseudomonas putida TaxID=303 RepID=A0A1Y3KY57_PSEPU|nr:hypothetical protein [Pseudomonas putida]OUM30044.1 hypothetical protein B8W72_18220 [Pseudomonas putida]